MPEARAWVDKKIYQKFQEACTKLDIEREADCIQLALGVFAALVKKCEEKKVSKEKCFDVMTQVVEVLLK